MTTSPPRWTYAIAQGPSRPYRPDGPGRHSTAPGRPVEGVVALRPNGFHWLGAFDEAIEPVRWGYRATLDEATPMAIEDADASGDPVLGWRAWDEASSRAARTRVVDAWYAWMCERWPVWRRRMAEQQCPPTLTIPETTRAVSRSAVPDFSVAHTVRRDSLVIGRPGDRGRWRPIGPVDWLPAGTWPSVICFHSIAQADGSWSSDVRPVIETPAWPPTPLMLPGGPANLHTWAERLPEFVATQGGITLNHFWTGCWNSLAGLPVFTGILRDPPTPAVVATARRR